MKRFLLPLLVFFAYLGIVGMGASVSRDSPLSKVLDLSLLMIHLGLIALLSILLLKERASHGKARSMVLLRIRRWSTDDPAV